MKKILTILVLTLACFFCTARGNDDAAIIEEIKASAEALDSFQCDYVQTTIHPMLKSPSAVTGRMYYRRPMCFRMCASDNSTIMIANGNRLLMGNATQTTVYDAGTNRMANGFTQLILGSISGELFTKTKLFQIDFATTDALSVIEFTPLTKDMKKRMDKLVVVFDRSSASVSQIEMVSGGVSNTCKLINMTKNVTLGDELFDIDAMRK